MKTLVVYYSKTGNNKFLAEKISSALQGDLLPIRPRLNMLPLLILFTVVKKSAGIRKQQIDVNVYDRIVLCGPIWMGQLISPISDFLNKNRDKIKKLHFVTCSGTSESEKESKFGYGAVFRKVENLMGGKLGHSELFSVTLVLPEEKRDNSDAVMKTRLSEENFSGDIQERFEKFVSEINR
ncbi:hypothetical protein CHISP_3330 [Chitinispirillum alkaliphilum]|nr:hypothetical protein CHISP_3330 [Chitinispirillum alkaliphilum]